MEYVEITKNSTGYQYFFLCATMLIVKVEVQVSNIQDALIKLLNIYIGSTQFLFYDPIYIIRLHYLCRLVKTNNEVR